MEFVRENKTEMKKESAGGIIVNELDEVVMVFTDTKSWQFPKGTVERGEGYLKTALREIKEETGLINLKLIKKLPRYTRISDDEGNKVYRDIHYFLFNKRKQKLKPSAEITACEWIPLDKAEDKITYKEDKEFFRRIRLK